MEKNNIKLKEKIRQTYGRIALSADVQSCCGSSSQCCADDQISNSISPLKSSQTIGYGEVELKSIPQSSILGVGCGNPVKFAFIDKGDRVVDLGSGAGIDVFLAANKVGKNGHVIGIDITEAMIEKARINSQRHGYENVEFREGDIEEKIPVDDNSVDVVISNCVINLTSDKVKTFTEIYRILNDNEGQMVISDLVTDKEIEPDAVDTDKWCACVDGAMTADNYINSIKKAGFSEVEILEQRPYVTMEENSNSNNGNNDNNNEEKEKERDIIKTRKISSVVVRAVKYKKVGGE